MYWANFLHIYQPPTQKEVWIRRIADESYRKLVSGLLKIERAKITLNINGVLCELLDKYGGKDILENINKLLKRGSLELTGSAKYHALLALLPESEIERQILLNEETLSKYFGNHWKRGGFFSPEMAYSKKVATIAAKLGYRWIIVDELGFSADQLRSSSVIYEIGGIDNLFAFFRERNFSFKILSASQVSTLPALLRFLEPRFGKEEYAITAMDGETFGHHRPGLENLLFDLLKEERIRPVAISDLIEIFKKREVIEPRPSTWASTIRDLKLGQPFIRWQNPENALQRYQWELTNLAIEIVARDSNQKARTLLDSAIHSDQYWWASARPWWSLEMIERGAFDLREVINKSTTASEEEGRLAEELYRLTIYTGFEWQRSGFVDELSRQENDEIRERLEEKEKLFVTEDEYKEMIKTLTEQMKSAAAAEEYHRAAMIKDRIREFKEEMEKWLKQR